MVNKVISGGQTGIDRLGLEIATKLNIATGGTAPHGYITENGVDLSLKQFGLIELPPQRSIRDSYVIRTEQNVVNSDGTVYFKTKADTAGFMCTKKFAKIHKKPFIVNPSKEEFRKWLNKYGICTLNVAGNRGSRVNADLYIRATDVITAGLTQTQLQLDFLN